MPLPPATQLQRTILDLEAEARVIADTINACRALLDTLNNPPPTVEQPSKRGPKPGATRKPIRHGTDGGYNAHRRRGEIPCDSCSAAHRRQALDRRYPNRPENGRTGDDWHDLVACPHCGELLRRGGYGPHRNKKHPDSKARPLPADVLTGVKMPDRPCPPSAAPTVPGRVFVCDDCGHVNAQIAGITRHTLGTHGRPPLTRERTPVTPEVAA